MALCQWLSKCSDSDLCMHFGAILLISMPGTCALLLLLLPPLLVLLPSLLLLLSFAYNNLPQNVQQDH